MLALLVLCALTAAPAEPKPIAPLKVATGGFTYVGISAELKAFVPEQVSTRLRAAGITVVTPSEIQALLGLERQRQLIGCSDDTGSCLAELAGALGADAVLLGELAKVGDVIQLNLKMIAGDSGKALASFSTRVDGENRLLDALDQAADAVAQQLLIETGRLPRPAPQGTSPRGYSWIPGAVGVAFVGAGTAMAVMAKVRHDQLTIPTDTPLTPGKGPVLASQGSNFQVLGAVGLGVGAAALVTAAGLFIFGKPAPVTTQLSISANGAGVTVGGSFP